MRTLHTIVCAALASALALGARPAAATENRTEASKTGKGITGGVLLGAEVVMLGESAFKVKKPVIYIVGGLIGGVGGGVGGYYIEKGASDAKVPMYMLAGGMALIIPTTVAVLSASAYEPPADYTQDKGPSDEPVAEPPRAAPTPPPGASPPAAPPPQSQAPSKRRHVASAQDAATLYLPMMPPALVGMSGSSLTLGVPAVMVGDVYTRTEVQQFGVKQATEVRVPVFNFFF